LRGYFVEGQLTGKGKRTYPDAPVQKAFFMA
jgi:hypothetical protein